MALAPINIIYYYYYYRRISEVVLKRALVRGAALRARRERPGQKQEWSSGRREVLFGGSGRRR